MMLEYFDVDNLRLLYCDTDSIFMAMGVDEMDDLVKPELKEKWLQTRIYSVITILETFKRSRRA